MNIKLIFLLCCAFVFANEYEFIDLSNNKEELSKEIFKKLEREHYLKELNKDNFNKKYFEAIIEKLDENKNLFIKDEIELYLKRSDLYDDYFDIELAYELINLYFERLMYFLKYQIELIKKNQFDLLKDEYLDIYNEDNQWQSRFDDLKEIWRLETKNDLFVST